MPLIFSSSPGAHERRLQRMADNPLFPEEKRAITQIDINAALAEDQEDLRRFLADFQKLVQRAVELEPNVDSEVVLGLKEELDKAYERCSSLMGDQQEIKNAINRLVEVVMVAVRKEAANDPYAQQKLEDEALARATHFRLQDHPVVADLMREDSVIGEDELVPTILNETDEAVTAVVQLFAPEQRVVIARDARTLLETLRTQGLELPDAWRNLASIEDYPDSDQLDQSLNG